MERLGLSYVKCIKDCTKELEEYMGFSLHAAKTISELCQVYHDTYQLCVSKYTPP